MAEEPTSPKRATLDDYLLLVNDRPNKMTAEQVDYKQAPEGSAMRCAACLHFFRRAIDDFSVCEIMRDLPESDIEGIYPDYRCQFYTSDGHVFPLLPEDDDEGR